MAFWLPRNNSAARRPASAQTKRTPRSSWPEPLPRQPISICRAATLTITNLLNEQAGSGELAQGLPLVLTAAPGSRRNLALFVDQSRPNIVSVTIQDAGSGKFIFRIKVNDATINSPQTCSPARLTTSFRLEGFEQAAHRCQHGAIVVLLRTVEQISQDSLSGVSLRRGEQGGNTMNRTIRSVCSTLGEVVILCAFAGSLCWATRRRPLIPKNRALKSETSTQRPTRCYQGPWLCSGQ